MKDNHALLKCIEELREEMYRTMNNNSDLQDSRMLDISRKLDKYLVEYQRLLEEKGK